MYCQAGVTRIKTIHRRRFVSPYTVREEVSKAIDRLDDSGVRVDYVSFVPTGEPTLDLGLGLQIRLVLDLGVKVAVFTNSSLLWRRDVVEDLMDADYISVKIDAGSQQVFREINRPHERIVLSKVIRGLKMLCKEYSGVIEAETMVVRGVNDSSREFEAIANILAELECIKVHIILTPVRPPALSWVKPPESRRIELLAAMVKAYGIRARVLSELEPSGYGGSLNDAIEDLLSMIRVHPIPLDRLRDYCRKRGVDETRVLEEVLRRGGRLVRFNGKLFIRFES